MVRPHHIHEKIKRDAKLDVDIKTPPKTEPTKYIFEAHENEPPKQWADEFFEGVAKLIESDSKWAKIMINALGHEVPPIGDVKEIYDKVIRRISKK